MQIRKRVAIPVVGIILVAVCAVLMWSAARAAGTAVPAAEEVVRTLANTWDAVLLRELGSKELRDASSEEATQAYLARLHEQLGDYVSHRLVSYRAEATTKRGVLAEMVFEAQFTRGPASIYIILQTAEGRGWVLRHLKVTPGTTPSTSVQPPAPAPAAPPEPAPSAIEPIGL